MRVSLCLCLGAAVAACNLGGPSLEERNAVRAVPDPTADATSPSAPFLPGQRRSVADANAAFAIEAYNQWVTGVTLPGDLDRDGFDDLVLWGQLANPPDTVPCDRGCPAFGQVAAHIVYGGADFGRSPPSRARRHAAELAPQQRARPRRRRGRRRRRRRPRPPGERGDRRLRAGQRVRGARRRAAARASSTCATPARCCARRADASVSATPRAWATSTATAADDFAVASPTTRRVHLYYGTPGAPPTRRSEADADARFVSASRERPRRRGGRGRRRR